MTKIFVTDTDGYDVEEADAGERGRCEANGLVPLMTWADWELLQELHKARNGEGTTIQVQFVPLAELSADTELFPSYDKQYESLARPAGTEAPTGRGGAIPAMLWQAVAADLRDQIKDWETKCKQLETERDDYHRLRRWPSSGSRQTKRRPIRRSGAWATGHGQMRNWC